jgi:hypothetical protein
MSHTTVRYGGVNYNKSKNNKQKQNTRNKGDTIAAIKAAAS